MKEPFVFLCPEITRENALNLVKWLQDKEVTKYLSDPEDVSNSIQQVIARSNLPVLTPLFSRDGRFYMVYNKQNAPVGFVRLVSKGSDYEIVIVIGDRNNWGQRLGTTAIKECMKLAFFELRAEKIIANIHKDNSRSIRAFVQNNFAIEKEGNTHKTFCITMERFLMTINNRTVVGSRIYITKTDAQRLEKVLQADEHVEEVPEKLVQDLKQEINRAEIVDSEQIAHDVITMNSRVLLHLDGDDFETTLVYPQDANRNNGISIFSPIGTAILGYREGSIIEWEMPSGVAKIHVKKVLYQPEAAGDYYM